jgi:flavin reductase (DIM6/NTAB) family NADH-FMN oxidoreductase RutF
MATDSAIDNGDEMRRLTPEEFRDVIGHFASGVTVITAFHDGKPFGTTASAFTSLSLEPPMVLVCMNKTSETGMAIHAAGHFAVNILSEEQQEEAKRFAGKGENKFDGLETAPGIWGEPLLPGSLATLECQVTEETTGGTHWVFLAEVLKGSTGNGAPLAYWRGAFGRLIF